MANNRKNVTTTLDKDLYKKLQILALNLEVGANDLIEEGMALVLKKNGVDVDEWQKLK